MRNLTITKVNFVSWYFEDGQDSEIESLKSDVAEKVISRLLDDGGAKLTVEELFNDCNKDAIKLCYTEEYDALLHGEGDTEIGDKFEEFEITLVQ